jgi:hypothetical protein
MPGNRKIAESLIDNIKDDRLRQEVSKLAHKQTAYRHRNRGSRGMKSAVSRIINLERRDGTSIRHTEFLAVQNQVVVMQEDGHFVVDVADVVLIGKTGFRIRLVEDLRGTRVFETPKPMRTALGFVGSTLA